MKRLILLLCCIVILTPGIVHAANDCSDDPTNCLGQEDLYSINNTSGWYDPREQAKANACDPTGDQSGDAATTTTTTKAPITFPAGASPEDKIAQTFMIGIDAGSTSPADVMALVKQFPVGGLYFTGTTDAGAKGFTKTFFDSLNAATSTPLIIASDEEGASSSDGLTAIHRFAYGDTSFPVAKDLGSKSADEIETIAQGAGKVMASYGITADLAPVLDVDNGRGAASQSVISKYGRSFSADPTTITTAAGAFAKGLQDAGIGAVYKHFPGLGSAWNGDAQGNNTDSFKINGPTLAALKQKDLVPYQKLVGQNNAAVMLSNEYISDWDGGNVPVSESPAAVTYLRNDLKFSGLVMTDSLTGPAQYQNGGSVAVAVSQSEQAGVNMVLFDSKGVDLGAVINQVKKSSLLATGSSKLDDSITKIIAYKNQSGNGSRTPSLNGGCCSQTTNLTGSAIGEQNKPLIWSVLTGSSWNLTPGQAAGVMGNMQVESGFEPQRQQGTSSGTVTPAKEWKNINGGGWGLVQWTPGSKMIDPTLAANRNPDELGTQLDFLRGQLFGKDLGSSLPETEAGSALIADPNVTPEGAADIFGYKYERFGTNSGSTRSTFARAIYNEYVNNTPAPPNTDPTTPSDTPVGAQALTNAITSGCTDGGGDFSGNASQLAQQMLAKWGSVYTGEDGAKQDLLDTAAGKDIKSSDTCNMVIHGLDPALLQVMLKLGLRYKLFIGSFITGHGGCNPPLGHPRGWAVDIITITDSGGNKSSFCNRVMSGAVCPNIAIDKPFYAYLASIAPPNSILMQPNCGGRGDGVKAPPGVQIYDYDWCDHQHFNVHQDELDKLF